MLKRSVFIVGAILFQGAAYAATIYSETGPWAGSNALGVPNGTHVYTAGWTTTTDYLNVAVAAIIGQDNGPVTISAYLTTQIGPGTTTAQQIAATTIAPASNAEMDVLFSGLTLPAGSYFLTLTSAPSTGIGYWGFTNNSALVTGAGVTPGPVGGASVALCGTPDLTYAPASTFCTSASPNPLNSSIFNVTGDLAPVPEPSALALLPGALLLMSVRRMLLSRSSKLA